MKKYIIKDITIYDKKSKENTTINYYDNDFNQYKYLIETRLSGALTLPKSAIHLSESTVTGANDKKGGMTYGKRQADREAEEGDKGSEGKDRKSTRLNSSHVSISYAVFCLKKKMYT